MPRIAAAAAMAAAVSPTSSTTSRSARLTVCSISSSISSTGSESWGCPPNGTNSSTPGGTHHRRDAGLLRSKTDRHQGRPDEARDRDPYRQQRQEDGRRDDDVSEATEADMLAERRGTCPTNDIRYLAIFGLNDCDLLLQRRLLVRRDQRIVSILDTQRPGDPLELLPPRITRGQMALNVPQQAGHLAEHVVGGRKGEDERLGGVEVAQRALDECAVAKRVESSIRIRLLAARGDPGGLQVMLNRGRQNRLPLRGPPSDPFA